MNNLKNIKETIKQWEQKLSWSEYFMSISHLTASRSDCKKLHVGCILVKDRRIISSGYNGYLSTFPHISMERDNHELATVHAEQNTISDCAQRGVNTKGAIAFITHFPCIHCFKILVSAGINTIIYDEDYKNDDFVYKLAEMGKIKIIRFRDSEEKL